MLSKLSAHSQRRRLLALTMMCALAVSVVACSEPDSVTSSETSASASASASSSPTPTVPELPLTVTRVADDKTPVMEIERVPGLAWHEREDESGARVSTFTIPGADALNAALQAQATAQFDAYRKSAPGATSRHSFVVTPPASAGPGLAAMPKPARAQLAVTTTLTAVSPDVIGARMTELVLTPSQESLHFRSYYYDTAAKTAVGGSDLFADDAARASFAAAVRTALATGPGVDPAAAAAVPDPQTWESAVFRNDGSLVAELSQGVVPGLGSVAVPLSAKTVTPWLSPLGTKVAEAAQKPGTFPADAPPLPAGSAPQTAGYGTSAAVPPAVNCAVEKCVALTFDDGPVPDSGRLLDMLKQKNVKATFFTVGTMAKAHPGLLQRELAEGHEIGNHSMSHGNLAKMSREKLEYEIATNSTLIEQAIGKKPTIMRPPYGAYNDQVNQVLAEHGMQDILWDVDTADWSTRNPDATVAAVDNLVQPGSIVLMHDIHRESVDATPRVIDVLAARGYKFVTVSELLAGTNPQPGQTISFRPGSFAGSERTAG